MPNEGLGLMSVGFLLCQLNESLIASCHNFGHSLLLEDEYSVRISSKIN